MRYSVIAFSMMIFFVACNNHSPKNIIDTNILPVNSKLISLKLSDSLGIVTFSIPNRYDTFFNWTNWSDCGKPCATVEYRYQLKSNPIFLETGFMHKELTDSVDQFTIEHPADLHYSDGTFSRGSFARILDRQKRDIDALKTFKYKITFDTIEKKDNRYFSIIMCERYDSVQSVYTKSASVTTTIKNNGVSFSYTLLTKDNDSINKTFIENSKKLIQTIKIKNGI